MGIFWLKLIPPYPVFGFSLSVLQQNTFLILDNLNEFGPDF